VLLLFLLFDGTAQQQQQLTKRKRSPPALLFVLRDEYHLTPFENHNNISQQQTGGRASQNM
jgi:hypothetical protein